MTKRERLRVIEAMRLFRTPDGYTDAMRILRVLAGGPAETAFEKAVREATAVPISAFFKDPDDDV